MQHKTLTSNSIIFLMILIVVFSSFSINFVLAEPTSEQSVEATTDSQVINNYTEPGKTLDLKDEGAIVIDAETGLVIYEKNPDERLYPASITKIMTTLLACEYGKYDEVVIHSDNAINGIGYGSSTMGMQVGEQISLESALYGIMMYSANETSMAVAEHISGSVDKFVEMMNNRAKELGCTGTHFANPHGFHDPNHYTTPRDMSLITKEAVKNEDFTKFWGTVDYTLPKTNLVDYERHLHTKVKMLDKNSDYYYQYAIGAKTGFHDDAMNTLVACAVKDGKKVIAVAMKDPGYVAAYADVQLLCEYAFTQFENKQLYDGAEYTDTVSLYQKYNKVDYVKGDDEVVVN